jgi:hypothetical protein
MLFLLQLQYLFLKLNDPFLFDFEYVYLLIILRIHIFQFLSRLLDVLLYLILIRDPVLIPAFLFVLLICQFGVFLF